MANINIDKLLKRYKLEQKDLAESTGINRNTINKYFNNKFENINRTHIDLICKYFKCTPNDLFEIDDTVEVTPAKILYYDDETDDFTYGEIAHAVISPLTWIGSKIVKGAIQSTTNAPVKQSKIEEELIKESKKYEWYDTLPTETKNEIFQAQERFDSELLLDKAISNFIDILIDGLFTKLNFESSVKEIFQNSKGYDYFTTNLKVEKFYTYFYRFLNHYSDKNNERFITFLNDIKNIYTNGGLEKLSDNELNSLKDTVEFLINEDKQKD